jgi:transcriptional regulator GlxA family with amidase domain
VRLYGLAKFCETLFVETLRRYIGQLPERQTGWLAGARDPEVSRSVLAERFRQYLGEPPVSYLTRWRLQLGAQMLASTSYSVAQIATEVGYESEPAFNRAFKKQFLLPPARFRTKSRSAPRIAGDKSKGIPG